jgi:hypothetical protein
MLGIKYQLIKLLALASSNIEHLRWRMLLLDLDCVRCVHAINHIKIGCLDFNADIDILDLNC